MKLLNRTKKLLISWGKLLNNRRKIYFKKFIRLAEKKPVTVFVMLLGILLTLIVLSNLINKPKEISEEITLQAKEVEVYTIGTSPKVTVQAQIEKSGVLKVVALAPGIIQSINVEVGQEVEQGQNLVSMSTNYQGGNSFSAQRQLAQVQYKNVLDTYETNKELINNQKELAEKSDKSTDDLRNISNQSLDASRLLVNLNKDILDTLTTQQEDLEDSNVGGSNDPAILQIKQLRAQLQAGNNQLESALRNTEYSGSDSNAPAQISNISKDIALKQLEIQEKTLKMNKEISRLSVLIAQINEAIMFPSAPFYGVVERVYVKQGQAVNPGTPLVQLSGSAKDLIAVALLSKEIAQSVSRSQVSTLHFGGKSYDSAPFYVSSEATDGALYTAQYSVPQEFNMEVADRGYILIDVPIDFPKTGSVIPFIPIDAVFQTQNQAFVFVIGQGKAISREIKLGQVLGRFVEVKEGLRDQDQVILNRNVIQGDPVKVVN